MAMTPEPAERDQLPDLDEADLAWLRTAADDLRHHVDDRWVEVSRRILTTALSATRRSRPIRALSATGPVHVNEQVIIAYLREAVDNAVPAATMTGITVHTSGGETFDGLTIEMVAPYGVPLIPLADRTREVAADVLNGILGLLAPPIMVSTMHVHFGDVARLGPPAQDRRSQ